MTSDEYASMVDRADHLRSEAKNSGMRNWIKVCRETGKSEPISEKQVRDRLGNYYGNVELMMDVATREVPASTPYAEYYPDRPLEDDE